MCVLCECVCIYVCAHMQSGHVALTPCRSGKKKQQFPLQTSVVLGRPDQVQTAGPSCLNIVGHRCTLSNERHVLESVQDLRTVTVFRALKHKPFLVLEDDGHRAPVSSRQSFAFSGWSRRAIDRDTGSEQPPSSCVPSGRTVRGVATQLACVPLDRSLEFAEAFPFSVLHIHDRTCRRHRFGGRGGWEEERVRFGSEERRGGRVQSLPLQNLKLV